MKYETLYNYGCCKSWKTTLNVVKQLNGDDDMKNINYKKNRVEVKNCENKRAINTTQPIND